MLTRDSLWILQEHLAACDYYSTKHARIYEAMLDLSQRGSDIDLITLSEELSSRGWLDICGGSYYLTELTSTASGSGNAEYHALIVKEKAMLRRLIEVSSSAVGKAYDPGSDVFDLIDETERQILDVRGDTKGRSESFPQLLKSGMAKLESIHGSERGITGIEFGNRRLDELTCGWQKKNFIIIAARPSMGKTAFALQAIRAAAGAGIPSVMYSIEMGADECVHRLLCSEARIDSQLARQGRLTDDDWTRLARAAGKLADLPIFIEDAAQLTDLTMRASLRRLHHDHQIGLAVIDYIQLMSATGLARGANREQEISAISRGMKATAKEIDVPVVALSQLSRAVETRGGDRRPQLSDLRESGSLEQDADVVGFLYRPEYYGITVDEDGHSTQGMAELIIAKQRNGPVGTCTMAWIKEYGRFENVHRSGSTATQPTNYSEPQEAPF